MCNRILKFLSVGFLTGALSSTNAQCIPETEEVFFLKLKYDNKLPERLLKGRTILFYDYTLSPADVGKIQKAFAGTGIDAVVAIETAKLLGGQDVTQAIFNALQKREISNLIFLHKGQPDYRCVITAFNNKPNFVTTHQSAWQTSHSSLSEVLLQVNREALANFKRQNLLISDQPETDLSLTIISGSRIESFTPDLRVDRIAVRLSGRASEDDALKNMCKQLPFKMEFVADSISDVDLRLKGFWYVLNCVRGKENIAKGLLGYAAKNPATSFTSTDNPETQNDRVYKFYFKKLEFDNSYLGKVWDGASEWPKALENFIANVRKELDIR